MNIIPVFTLSVDGKKLTLQQLRALSAVHDTKSQTRAAQRLGISVPVLHRYIHQIEDPLGIKVVRTSPLGTVLTDEGKEIVREYRKFLKLGEKKGLRMGCSPVTMHIICKTIDDAGYNIDVIVSNDEVDLSLAGFGLLDIVVLDDPLYAFEYEGKAKIVELFEDNLLLLDRGTEYMRYAFGAQRIGYRYLAAKGIEHRITGTAYTVEKLLKSGCSFFLNESIVKRLGIRPDFEDLALNHSLVAMDFTENEDSVNLLSLLKRRKTFN